MRREFAILAAIAMLGAAPSPSKSPAALPPVFPAASVVKLSNGVTIASQPTADTPIAAVQVFLPAGLAQQPAVRGGVSAVTASIVLHTPVEGAADVSDVARNLGGSATYTIDPEDTRFYLEGKASDMPRLLNDLHAAISKPDISRFATERTAALASANAAVKDPALVAYTMVRQVQYEGSGYAFPDAGQPIALSALVPKDVEAFAALYRHGANTVVALTGNVTADVLTAAKSAFADFPSEAAPRAPATSPVARTHEVVAHRDIATPWVAIGYAAPSQFSSDFPAMLVVQALLGRGGGIHSFSYGPDTTPVEEYVGGYYQYEAQPGAFVVFYSGSNVDQDLRGLSDSVSRLRGSQLPPELVNRAKRTAVGEFLTSVTTLDDESWLLGRSVMSPSGISFENDLPGRIAGVTAADVQRVARKYLATQTVAIVLPSGAGQ